MAGTWVRDYNERRAFGPAVPYPSRLRRQFHRKERSAPHLGATTHDAARGGIMADLFNAVMYGVVNLHTVRPNCVHTVSERPQAHPLAVYQARRGPVVINAHHQAVTLDPLAAEVLKLADGHRTPADIVELLVPRVTGGEIVIEDGHAPVTESEEARAALIRHVADGLTGLRRTALLIG